MNTKYLLAILLILTLILLSGCLGTKTKSINAPKELTESEAIEKVKSLIIASESEILYPINRTALDDKDNWKTFANPKGGKLIEDGRICIKDEFFEIGPDCKPLTDGIVVVFGDNKVWLVTEDGIFAINGSAKTITPSTKYTYNDPGVSKYLS